ncbi:Nif3-like dinuclear metal center hexameric protein [Desulfofundulus thermocisternus]|uniref:Nif3-like dinuclear metal center hexameric protein n=1 Tax=Desulfofundulus thermocisternus TaxID=42471 RepID=UPI00217E9E0B|nr:Nif3-like dinuclear metal center hexameric protein [Desulfofundulus thermocisternus]MCS5695714.1 Nif3-like dinuclear metal center hexameric protein [Desulfofundulus thermocisternus]
MAETTVQEVLEALNLITGGRVITGQQETGDGRNPYVILKTSHIPGKEVMETPGLVYGDPAMPVKKLAVVMTMTESVVELAAASGVDALVVHHPVADAASCGGVPLKDYLHHYRLAVFELHEAFHGLHPGIALLHGHMPVHIDVCFGGTSGNVVIVGKPLAGISCLKDILARLELMMGQDRDVLLLEAEKRIYQVTDLQEINAMEGGSIINGNPDNEVGLILHCFPHTGFCPADLDRILEMYPEIKTVITSISRVRKNHPLIDTCRLKGLNLVAGNSHALEIWENGLPLAYALQAILSDIEVVIFRERVTSYPLAGAGNEPLRHYARQMAEKYLLPQRYTGK